MLLRRRAVRRKRWFPLLFPQRRFLEEGGELVDGGGAWEFLSEGVRGGGGGAAEGEVDGIKAVHFFGELGEVFLVGVEEEAELGFVREAEADGLELGAVAVVGEGEVLDG